MVRHAHIENWLNSILSDCRFAYRMLRKSPGYAAVAVLTLALGIGANTAIFSLLNAVMLQAIPVRHPEQLVVLQWSSHALPENIGGIWSYGDCNGCSFSSVMYRQVCARSDLFSSVLAMAGPAQLNISGQGEASIVRAEFISGNYFATLGVSAAIGRTIEPFDDQPSAQSVVVLSHHYWQAAFGSARDAVGKKIRLNGIPFIIVGVIDPRFARLTPGKSQDLWVPLSHARSFRPNWVGKSTDEAAYWWLTVVARLKPERSLPQAQAAVNFVLRNEVLHGAKPFFKEVDDPQITLSPAQKGLVGIRKYYAEPIFILMAAVGMVLLIACANIAGLMLVRATSREREMAVRLALGASKRRIVQQLLTESLLLSVAGAALGVLFAYWGADVLASFISSNADSPIVVDARPDAVVLAFTAGVALLTGIFFGLAPSFRSSGINVAPTLKGSGTSRSDQTKAAGRLLGLGSSLVVAQVALSVVVLIGAGLLVRTVVALRSINPGFDARNLLLFGIDPKAAGYEQDGIQTLYAELQRRLASIPGVISASYSSLPLLSNGLWTSFFHLEGQPDNLTTEINMLAVGTGFFETMRLPLVAGRTFSTSDTSSGRPIAIINQAFARAFLRGRNPIGTRFYTDKTQREIVGVVADAKYDNLRNNIQPVAYIPLKEGNAYFVLRTSWKPSALLLSVRHTVAQLDNNLPLSDIATQSEAIDRSLFNERLVALLSSLFGVLALTLACIGLYGLLSYEVARRTREIGIRTALGARPASVLRLILGQGFALALVGAVCGTIASMWATKFIQSLLFGVKPVDGLTLATVAVLLILVALLACYIPARRAMKVDPMVALRCE